MVSIDTNAVLALVIEERKEERQKVTHLLAANICYVADLVFPELEYVLTNVYNFSRQQVVLSIHALMTYQNIRCNVALLIEAVEIYAHSPALSFVDSCLAIEAGITRRTPLYTFDKKLANQVSSLVKPL